MSIRQFIMSPADGRGAGSQVTRGWGVEVSVIVTDGVAVVALGFER